MKTIAIVTGASSGIGKEFFLSLKNQAPVEEIWVVARSEEKLQALQAETETPIRVFPLDLSKTESSTLLENALKEETPEIQYLICASGFGRFCAVEEDDSAVLQNMVDLNCRSIVGVTKACYPYMKKGGLMILIASIAANCEAVGAHIRAYWWILSSCFAISRGAAIYPSLQPVIE